MEIISHSAYWLAHCRALESRSDDPLFLDDFAHLFLKPESSELIQGFKASPSYQTFKNGAQIRARLIDNQILKILNKKVVKQVLNLGAGYDTRPFRLKISNSIKWIELDKPKLLSHKNSILPAHKAKCDLLRIPIDFLDSISLDRFIRTVPDKDLPTLVISEGLLVYLNNETVSSNFKILGRNDFIKFWITDLATDKIYNYRNPGDQDNLSSLVNQMKFTSFPKSPFFKKNGWKVKKAHDMAIEGLKLGRPLISRPLGFKQSSLAEELESLNNANLAYVIVLEKNRRLKT